MLPWLTTEGNVNKLQRKIAELEDQLTKPPSEASRTYHNTKLDHDMQ